MKTSINLSEWLNHQFPLNMIKDKNKDFFDVFNQANAEINYNDILNHEDIISVLKNHGLVINNLRWEYPLLETYSDQEKNNKISNDQILELLKKWGIKNLTLIDTSYYPGHDISINTRLADTKMDQDKWNLMSEKLNLLGELCKSQDIHLMVTNHSGTIIENMNDFLKLSDNYNYGFNIDVPHFLYINEKMDQMDTALIAKIENKVTGIRLGSFTACAWVATRQNRYSWNESVRFGIFEPYKTEHKKMLKNFNQMILNRYNHLKTVSLICERNNELNNPLDNFKSAQAAFHEIIESQNLLKS